MCAVKTQDNHSGVIKSESPHRVEVGEHRKNVHGYESGTKVVPSGSAEPQPASALGSPVVATQKRQHGFNRGVRKLSPREIGERGDLWSCNVRAAAVRNRSG